MTGLLVPRGVADETAAVSICITGVFAHSCIRAQLAVVGNDVASVTDCTLVHSFVLDMRKQTKTVLHCMRDAAAAAASRDCSQAGNMPAAGTDLSA